MYERQLQAALGQAPDVPVLVFDEIESGIGARLGEALGSVLRRLAEGRQVVVVTHLAPVAAFAQAHLRVAKRVEAIEGTGVDSAPPLHGYVTTKPKPTIRCSR